MKYKILGCLLYSILNVNMGFSQEQKVIFYETNNTCYLNPDTNMMEDKPLSLAYAPNGLERLTEELYVMLDTIEGVIYSYSFDKKEKNKLLKGIKKYKEWNDIAIENGVTNQKTIQDFNVAFVIEIDSNSVPTAARNLKGKLMFVSLDTKRHYLLLRFTEIQAYNAPEKISRKMYPKSILLAYNDVLSLEEKLQDEFIEEKLEEIAKKEVAKKDIDKLFQ